MLANERGKARMSPNADLRPSKDWRVSILSSGEKGIADILSAIKQKPPAGFAVRLVEINADAGQGCGIFDKAPQGVDPKRWGAEQSRALKAAAAKFYGTAGPSFVGKIVERGADTVAEQAKRLVEQFKEKNVPPGATGQVLRVAERFGIIAAAGELAAEYGVLPWAKGIAWEAAQFGLSQWLRDRGDVGDAEERDALSQIRELLEQYGDFRFEDRFGLRDDEEPASAHIDVMASDADERLEKAQDYSGSPYSNARSPCASAIGLGKERSEDGSSRPRFGAACSVRGMTPSKWRSSSRQKACCGAVRKTSSRLLGGSRASRIAVMS